MKMRLLLLPFLLLSTVLPVMAADQEPTRNIEQTYRQIEHAIETVNTPALRELLGENNISPLLKAQYLQQARMKHDDLGRQLVSLQTNNTAKDIVTVPITIFTSAIGTRLGTLPGEHYWNDEKWSFDFWILVTTCVIAGGVAGFQLGKKLTESLSPKNNFERQRLQAKINDAAANVQLLEGYYSQG